jgi:hypothetical protein
MKPKAEYFPLAAWLLSGLVTVAAVAAWGQGLRWHFSGLSTYRIFPLFGLLAFSLIWSMYVVSFSRRLWNLKVGLKTYYKVLRLIVITVIFFHPVLLWWQLWRDGFGLPPESYLKHYVAAGLGWVAVLGTVSWFIFLTYDLGQKFKNRPWWKYIEFLGDCAMVAVFYHSLRLGTNLQHSWLKGLWYFYGLVLAVVLFDVYKRKLKA